MTVRLGSVRWPFAPRTAHGEQRTARARAPTINPWASWLAMVILGSLVVSRSDLEWELPSVGQLLLATLGYPIFLRAVRKAWPANRPLAAGGMTLHAGFLVAQLGVLEAAFTGHPLAASVLSMLIAVVSFVVPVYRARIEPRAKAPKTWIRVLSWAVLVVGAPLLAMVLSGNAVTLSNANVLRALCERRVDGVVLWHVLRYVPPYFVRTLAAPRTVAILSQGRGCIAEAGVDGTLRVVKLLPQWAFPWMLSPSLQAQFKLGLAYEDGRGVAQDYGAAVTWYREAAERGYPPAQTNLAECYRTGRGVPRDFFVAAEWYRRAADRGHPFAQHNLAAAYADGRGAPKDAMQAYIWFSLAAARYPRSESELRQIADNGRREMAAALTAAQRAEADRQIREWKRR